MPWFDEIFQLEKLEKLVPNNGKKERVDFW